MGGGLGGLRLAGDQDRVAREDRHRGRAHRDLRYLPPGDPGQRDGVEIQPLAKPRRAQSSLGRLPSQPDRLVHEIAAGTHHSVGESHPYVHLRTNLNGHVEIPRRSACALSRDGTPAAADEIDKYPAPGWYHHPAAPGEDAR
jgi:hypothetical protein